MTSVLTGDRRGKRPTWGRAWEDREGKDREGDCHDGSGKVFLQLPGARGVTMGSPLEPLEEIKPTS